MRMRQDWMPDYLPTQGQPPLAFVGSATAEEPPTAVARRMRDMLGLGGSWAKARWSWSDSTGVLRTALEDAGILVVVNGIVGNSARRPLDVDEFRGFVLTDEYAPLVFVNGRDGKAAQVFTLALELAHICLLLVFIEAANWYYAFGLAPGFWSCLVTHAVAGDILS